VNLGSAAPVPVVGRGKWGSGAENEAAVSGGVSSEAIGLARLGDRPRRRLAKDLGSPTSPLQNWIKRVNAERGERPGGLSRDEREELNRLRDENARLRMEREMLAKAAVLFAKESDGR
jgi:transposase